MPIRRLTAAIDSQLGSQQNHHDNQAGMRYIPLRICCNIEDNRWIKDSKGMMQEQRLTVSESDRVKSRIGKEEINQLPLTCWEGPTFLVRSAHEITEAVQCLSRAPRLGFDTETRPAFKKGQKFLPSLLQLATGEEVYIFQLQTTGLGESLRGILEDASIVKAGVAPDFDLLSLQELAPFTPGGFADLAHVARSKGIKNHGLRGLAAAICGIRISKSARTSNWASKELTPQQIRYAATDAWIGWELYRRLTALPDHRK